MKDQHKLIKGYRDLGQEDIDLMNRAKALEADILKLIQDVKTHVSTLMSSNLPEEEWRRYYRAKPKVWLNLGQDNLLTGMMQVVRAIAQPECQLYLKEMNSEGTD